MSNSADSGKQSKVNLLDWILLLGSLDVYSTKGFEKAKKKRMKKASKMRNGWEREKEKVRSKKKKWELQAILPKRKSHLNLRKYSW